MKGTSVAFDGSASTCPGSPFPIVGPTTPTGPCAWNRHRDVFYVFASRDKVTLVHTTSGFKLQGPARGQTAHISGPGHRRFARLQYPGKRQARRVAGRTFPRLLRLVMARPSAT